MKNKILIPVVCLMFTVGCSKDDPDENYKGGNCGTDVVSDYNDMISDCRLAALSSSSSYSCRSSVDSFLAKYPGISCDAESLSTGDRMTITESKVRSMAPRSSYSSTSSSSSSSDWKKRQKAAEEKAKQERLRSLNNYKDGKACGSTVITSYNVMVVANCKDLKPTLDTLIWETAKEKYYRCIQRSDDFLRKYPGINCKAANGTLDEDAIETGIQRWEKFLIEQNLMRKKKEEAEKAKEKGLTA